MNSRSLDNPDEFLPTRSSLIERLRDLDDQPSWREFFDTYWKLIYGAAIKAGLSDPEAEDVVQETVIGVARTMPDFHYDPTVCSFKGWLMHVTRRRIADRFRRRRSQNVPLMAPVGADTTTDTSLDLPDPSRDALEAIWNEEWQKNIVDAAMERVRRRADPGHYQIWLVRRSAYAASGAANAWSDSEPPFVLAKGAESRAQGITIDPAGKNYVSGRAKDAKGYTHTIIRRKAPGAGVWEKVYDKMNTSSVILETKICHFPGSLAAPAAYLMVGNENNKWTILRSLTGNLNSWTTVDTTWSSANAPAGATDITFDPQSGKLYAVGYRGMLGSGGHGWVVRGSADGGQTWSGLLDEACPPYSYADDVSIDAAGGVVVIGQIGVLSPNATWVPQMHLVRCTNPADALSWQSSFAGVPLPFDETNCYSSSGNALATDASGAIFLTGVVSGWLDSGASPAKIYTGNNVGLLRWEP